MVPPNGPAAARSTSTWIHWWSPVASANLFTRSWSISSQSLVPSSLPAAASSSSKLSRMRIRRLLGGVGRVCRSDRIRDMSEPTRPTAEQMLRAPKVLLHDHLDGGLRPATVLELGREVGHALPADDAESLGRWFAESADSG